MLIATNNKMKISSINRADGMLTDGVDGGSLGGSLEGSLGCS